MEGSPVGVSHGLELGVEVVGKSQCELLHEPIVMV